MMLLHRLFSVLLCAHYDQEKDGAFLELDYPDDESKEIVLCKVFQNAHGICSCVFGRQRIISPKLSLDPRTLFGMVDIANGWLEMNNTFHRNPAAIPDVDHAARTSQSLSGPVSVYFVLQLEFVVPDVPVYTQVLGFALGFNATLFSFDKEHHHSILDIFDTVGFEIIVRAITQVDVTPYRDGLASFKRPIHRGKSDTSVWALDFGVFIDFQNKQVAFVDVEQIELLALYHEIDTSQPLFAFLTISLSRARISSGRDVLISREMKAFLLYLPHKTLIQIDLGLKGT